MTLSSLVHRMGGLDVADLNWERRCYQRRVAYGQSKPADLMSAYELADSHERVVARALWDRAVELTDVRPDVASSPT